MCFNLNLYRKKYNLIIGKGRSDVVVVRYVFDGWKNDEIKKKFFGSFGYYEAEAIAGRTKSSLNPSGVLQIHVATPEVEGIGTPVGALLEASYLKSICSPEFIEKFLSDSGIAFHRAEPFSKPVKTIWKVLKEKLGF